MTKRLIVILLTFFTTLFSFHISSAISVSSPIHFPPLTQYPSGGISSTVPPKLSKQHPNLTNGSQFSILIDAGSTGSRLSIYSYDLRQIIVPITGTTDCSTSSSKSPSPWSNQCLSDFQLQKSPPKPFSMPKTNTTMSKKITPGLHTILLESVITSTVAIKNDILNEEHTLVYDTSIDMGILVDKTIQNLSPLISFALDKFKEIGLEDHIPHTPLFLLATGGVRSLLENEQNVLMSTVRSYLRSTGFYIENNFITIVSGEQEGLYGWISVNYLLSNASVFNSQSQEASEDENVKREVNASQPKPVGVIDLGGATLQMALSQITIHPLQSHESANKTTPHLLEDQVDRGGTFLSSFPYSLGDYNANIFIQCFWYFGKDTALFRIHNLLYNVLYSEELLAEQESLISAQSQHINRDHSKGKSLNHDSTNLPKLIKTSPQVHRPLIKSNLHLLHPQHHQDQLTDTQRDISGDLSLDDEQFVPYDIDISNPIDKVDNDRANRSHPPPNQPSPLSQSRTQKVLNDPSKIERLNHFVKKQLPHHWNSDNMNFTKYRTLINEHNYQYHVNPQKYNDEYRHFLKRYPLSEGDKAPGTVHENHHEELPHDPSRTRIFSSPCLPNGYETTFFPYSQLINPVNNDNNNNSSSSTSPQDNFLQSPYDIMITGEGDFDDCYQLAKQLIISRTTTPCYNTNDMTHSHHEPPQDQDEPENLSQIPNFHQHFLNTNHTHFHGKNIDPTQPPKATKPIKPPFTGQCTSFFGQYRPPYDDTTPFYLFSGFGYLGRWLNLTHTIQEIPQGSNSPPQMVWSTPGVNVTYIMERGREICQMSEIELVLRYPSEPKYLIHRYCWFSAYISALLHDGFRFDKANNNIHFVSNVNGTDVTYSTGAMVSLVNQLPFYVQYQLPTDPTIHPNNNTVLAFSDIGMGVADRTHTKDKYIAQAHKNNNNNNDRNVNDNRGFSYLWTTFSSMIFGALLAAVILLGCRVRQLSREVKREQAKYNSIQGNRFKDLAYNTIDSNAQNTISSSFDPCSINYGSFGNTTMGYGGDCSKPSGLSMMGTPTSNNNNHNNNHNSNMNNNNPPPINNDTYTTYQLSSPHQINNNPPPTTINNSDQYISFSPQVQVSSGDPGSKSPSNLVPNNPQLFFPQSLTTHTLPLTSDHHPDDLSLSPDNGPKSIQTGSNSGVIKGRHGSNNNLSSSRNPSYASLSGILPNPSTFGIRPHQQHQQLSQQHQQHQQHGGPSSALSVSSNRSGGRSTNNNSRSGGSSTRKATETTPMIGNYEALRD